MAEFINLRVKRQDGPNQPVRWENFKVPYLPKMNVISVLMEIQRNPVTAEGTKTTPVVWECNCLEEVCGACSMNINGTARQACTALIDQLQQPIVLEPLTKFPLVRDLMVDRQVMFDNLKKVKAWIPIDGTYDLGPGPRMAEETRQWAYELSKCMTCGCCAEACPQFNSRANFIGPAAISQARLFNTHPTGNMNKHERLAALMDKGGISDCGNAQNCVQACPKAIPLTTSIADLNREVNKFAVGRWLRK
ncbi:MAG: succinate dehydrogenase iron-sulfur subunit [Peptococcaceae bacterium]|nr:succinate dehydrogenase iron-sulfur subunit [Peptococcaceae bacterium]